MNSLWRRNIIVIAVFGLRATACGGSVGCGGKQMPEANATTTPAVPQSSHGGSACTKDTECKGERVCENSACVDPPAAKK